MIVPIPRSAVMTHVAGVKRALLTSSGSIWPRAKTMAAKTSQIRAAKPLAIRKGAGRTPGWAPPQAASPQGRPEARSTWKAATIKKRAASAAATIFNNVESTRPLSGSLFSRSTTSHSSCSRRRAGTPTRPCAGSSLRPPGQARPRGPGSARRRESLPKKVRQSNLTNVRSHV